jgi:hypothetical protein
MKLERQVLTSMVKDPGQSPSQLMTSLRSDKAHQAQLLSLFLAKDATFDANSRWLSVQLKSTENSKKAHNLAIEEAELRAFFEEHAPIIKAKSLSDSEFLIETDSPVNAHLLKLAFDGMVLGSLGIRFDLESAREFQEAELPGLGIEKTQSMAVQKGVSRKQAERSDGEDGKAMSAKGKARNKLKLKNKGLGMPGTHVDPKPSIFKDHKDGSPAERNGSDDSGRGETEQEGLDNPSGLERLGTWGGDVWENAKSTNQGDYQGLGDRYSDLMEEMEDADMPLGSLKFDKAVSQNRKLSLAGTGMSGSDMDTDLIFSKASSECPKIRPKFQKWTEDGDPPILRHPSLTTQPKKKGFESLKGFPGIKQVVDDPLTGGMSYLPGFSNAKFTCRYDIAIEHSSSFPIAKKIIGSNGCNMKDIIEKSRVKGGNLEEGADGVKLRLRGRGSGFKEGHDKKESNEGLHLCVSAKNEAMFAAACWHVEKLLQKIFDDYLGYLRRTGDSRALAKDKEYLDTLKFRKHLPN